MVRRRYREGVTELASNQITAGLGDTINGEVAVNGQSPKAMKAQIDAMSDMQQQVNTSSFSGDAAATPMAASETSTETDPRAAKEDAINALLGNTEANKLNLDQVEDDQMDLLLANASVLGAAGKK